MAAVSHFCALCNSACHNSWSLAETYELQGYQVFPETDISNFCYLIELQAK